MLGLHRLFQHPGLRQSAQVMEQLPQRHRISPLGQFREKRSQHSVDVEPPALHQNSDGGAGHLLGEAGAIEAIREDRIS